MPWKLFQLKGKDNNKKPTDANKLKDASNSWSININSSTSVNVANNIIITLTTIKCYHHLR